MCRDNLPVWQKRFEKYGSDDFTVVGLALDVEGVAPAKRYYDKYGVTFPSLVDPNYATKFGAVPKTFFVDEFGVVQNSRNWERQLAKLPRPRDVPDEIRAQWSNPGRRLDSAALSDLAAANARQPDDPAIAAQLGARYIELGLLTEASTVLQRAAAAHDAKATARRGGSKSRLLGQVYLQLSRSHEGDRDKQVDYATMSYYMNPTIGFGKQIARLISPEKFDDRRDGSLDDPFREATLQRLIRERKAWLAE